MHPLRIPVLKPVPVKTWVRMKYFIILLLDGFIRKEGALMPLVVLAGTPNLLEFMAPLQLFAFAIVVTIYVPCMATMAMPWRETGWKNAALISICTFPIALLIGGAFYHLNPLGFSAPIVP